MSDKARLVLLSFLMLFVELALIRWTGSNVVYLSYFSNFVLLGSFLGIGVGFLRARAKVDLFPWAPVVLAFLVVFVHVFPVEIDRSGSQLIYFGTFLKTGLPTWVTLPVVFMAAALIMEMIAEGVARTFRRFESLEAYRLDIIGSIVGIVAFSVLSFLRAPPVAWGVVAAALFVVLLGNKGRLLQWVVLVGLVVMLLSESLSSTYSWSPYYKVKVSNENYGADRAGRWQIDVNGIPHQEIGSVERRRTNEPFYFLPYERAKGSPLEDVLIVGAGNGTDVAIALANGAKRVDAVEIDPRLQQIGKELHPDKPYDDLRVDVTIDDGRAFLERTDRRYDLILFALPDSLTLVSGQSSLRLESYLFTTEAMRAARAHLKSRGVFGMYNYYREQWLIRRLERTLAEVYGRPPCTDVVSPAGGLALLTASDDPSALDCPNAQIVASNAPAPATDDHPFLYLRTNTIPGFYLLTIALILAASIATVRLAGGRFRSMRPYTDLFFMGAAFLLLETKSVVQFALLFGTTWFVNALVFTGILLSVLAAIEVSRRVRPAHPAALYAGLLGALVVAYAVPQHSLLSLSFGPRFLAAIALAFTPIFLANMVFAQRFRDVGSSTTAFGANLLGAMMGGVLEYASLVTGYRALLIVVAALYGLAFVFGRRALLPARA